MFRWLFGGKGESKMSSFPQLDRAIAERRQKAKDDRERSIEEFVRADAERRGGEAERKREEQEYKRQEALEKASVVVRAGKLDRAISAGLVHVFHVLKHEGRVRAGRSEFTRDAAVWGEVGGRRVALYIWIAKNDWELPFRDWPKSSESPFCEREIDTYEVALSPTVSGAWELRFHGDGGGTFSADDNGVDRGLARLYEVGPKRNLYYAGGRSWGNS